MVLVFSCGVSADFIADGNLGDWGVTPGSDWANSVGANEWMEPEVGHRGYVGPGWGGQDFNVEAVYARADFTYLYYAIVTGFPDGKVYQNNRAYYPGDVFIDIAPYYQLDDDDDPSGRIEFAIETTEYHHSSDKKGGKSSQGQGPGTFYSNVLPDLAENDWDDLYYPVGIERDGSKRLADGTLIGMTDFAYSDDFYGSDHYVIEGRVPLSYFGDLSIDGARLSWTMTCANDIGSVDIDAPFRNTTIPEPGSLMLAGSGCLLAFGIWRRRRIQ